jgi:hypothetical protein
MRLTSLVSIGIGLIAGSPLLAQNSPDAPPPQTLALPAVSQAPPAPPAPPSYTPSAPVSGGAVSLPPDYVPAGEPFRVIQMTEPYHVWLRTDFLAWRVKDAPLPVPIALVTDANGTSRTVIGNTNTDFGAFAGVRVALGAWFDQFNNYGFDTSFFVLERRSHGQAIASDGNGNPSLGLSFLSATPGQSGEFIQNLSVPGTFDGSIAVSSNVQLWGAEINGVVCLLRKGPFEFTTLAGFRYFELQESLNVSGVSTNLTTSDFIVLNDRFATNNQFYGGQVGARVGWQGARLAFDGTAKVALGGTHQSVNIQGSSFNSTSDTLAGGFYAQPSNMGRYTSNPFTVIPTVELKLSYIYSPWLRLFVGYDFMYWNQVVRPGNQIDRNINLTQSPLLGNGALTGPASPAPVLSRTDFWAQGITFGLEFRY